MDYGYKPTTNGRELLVACAATGKGLELTRVAVGSGMVPAGTDLADVHELYEYVANGTIGQRTHENDRLYMTVQYANSMEPELPMFYFSEFMVYAKHPETGIETDLLYATLGDYRQPVPAYSASLPASVFSIPMILIVSDEIEVTVTAPAGIVTHDDLQRLETELGAVRQLAQTANDTSNSAKSKVGTADDTANAALEAANDAASTASAAASAASAAQETASAALNLAGEAGGEAVGAHNNAEDAHPALHIAISSLESRLATLELKYLYDVTGNSFEISFADLTGLEVSGVWNKELARIEF